MKMKMKIKNILFFVAMILGIHGAFATTLQDVSACKKDMTCMQQTAKQFLKEHPNSDKGNYILAQIEANRGDFRAANVALQKAESLAGSMVPYPSFAGSSDQYNKLKSKIATGIERTQVDQRQTPVTQTQSYPSPSYQSNPSRIEVATPRDTAKSSSSGNGVGIFFGILAVIIASAVGFWMYSSNQKKKDLQKQKTEQLGKLNDYMEKTNKVILISKTDGLSNLESEAQQALQELNVMMQTVRSGNLVSDYQIITMENKVKLLKRTADSGRDWSTASSQAVQPPPQYVQPTNQSGGYSAPSYNQPVSVQQPQTVIVDRGSNNDLLTGMMIGGMMNSNHSSRSYDAPRQENVVVNNYNYGSNSDSVDFGGDDSDSRKSSSFDFGGNDSSSSSSDSVDFGGSDSSSSSND